MLKSLSLLVVVLPILSCNNESASSKSKATIATPSFTDSLVKYANSNQNFLFENKKAFAGMGNSVSFGVLPVTDSTMKFYQLVNNRWEITDTLAFERFQFIQQEDLNNDSLNDIIITYNVTGAGGNSENRVLLFDPVKKRFYHNTFYDLSNIRYNSATGLIQSTWWGGTISPQSKSTYRISGDSLCFEKGITYYPPETDNSPYAFIEFFSLKNNKRIVLEKKREKADHAWNIFEKTLWDTKGEY